jgi:hypothetical protein
MLGCHLHKSVLKCARIYTLAEPFEKIPKFYASMTNPLASAYICAYLCKWQPGYSDESLTMSWIQKSNCLVSSQSIGIYTYPWQSFILLVRGKTCNSFYTLGQIYNCFLKHDNNLKKLVTIIVCHFLKYLCNYFFLRVGIGILNTLFHTVLRHKKYYRIDPNCVCPAEISSRWLHCQKKFLNFYLENGPARGDLSA